MANPKKRAGNDCNVMSLAFFEAPATRESDAAHEEMMRIMGDFSEDDEDVDAFGGGGAAERMEASVHLPQRPEPEQLVDIISLPPKKKVWEPQASTITTAVAAPAPEISSIRDILAVVEADYIHGENAACATLYMDSVRATDALAGEVCCVGDYTPAAPSQASPPKTPSDGLVHLARHLGNLVVAKSSTRIIHEHNLLVCLLVRACTIANFRRLIGCVGGVSNVRKACFDIFQSADPLTRPSSSQQQQQQGFNQPRDTPAAHAVFWIHGPGGVGKTTLFSRIWSRHASASRRPVSPSTLAAENVISLKPESLSVTSVDTMLDFYRASISHIIDRHKRNLKASLFAGGGGRVFNLDAWMSHSPQRGMVPILLKDLDNAFEIARGIDAKEVTRVTQHRVAAAAPRSTGTKSFQSQNSERLLSGLVNILLSFGLVENRRDAAPPPPSGHHTSSPNAAFDATDIQPIIYFTSSSRDTHHLRRLSRILFRLPKEADIEVPHKHCPIGITRGITRPLLSQRLIVIPQPSDGDMFDAITRSVVHYSLATVLESMSSLRFATTGTPMDQTSVGAMSNILEQRSSDPAIAAEIAQLGRVSVSSLTKSNILSWCGEGRFPHLSKSIITLVKHRAREITLSGNPGPHLHASLMSKLASPPSAGCFAPFVNATPGNLFAMCEARASLYWNSQRSNNAPANSPFAGATPAGGDVSDYGQVFADASIACIQQNDAISLCLHPTVYKATRLVHARFFSTMVARHGWKSWMLQLRHNLEGRPGFLYLGDRFNKIVFAGLHRNASEDASISAIVNLCSSSRAEFDAQAASVNSQTSAETPDPIPLLAACFTKISQIVTSSTQSRSTPNDILAPAVACALWMTDVVHGKKHLAQCTRSIAWFHQVVENV